MTNGYVCNDLRAYRLGVYYFLSLTLSVCMFVMLLQIDSSFSFLDGIEPFFGHQLSMWHSAKRCSSIFDLGSLTPKIYSQNGALPKICTKSTIVGLYGR